MVSLSTGLTLGLIGAAILGFYKLGGASGIGSRLGGGFSDLFDSFGSALNPVSAITENPALNPVLVAQARYEEATTLDPNLAANRFVDPAGKYDPVAMGEAKRLEETISSTPDNFMDQFICKDRTPAPISTVVQYEDVPIATLPAYAGTLDYVVKTNFPNMRTASTQEKSFLQSFGIGV